MRLARPLVLLLLLAVLAVVGGSYYFRSKSEKESARVVPAAQPAGVVAAANDWTYYERDARGDAHVSIKAKDFRQLDNPPRTELTGVEVRVRTKDGTGYDRVTSAKAEFDQGKGTLYSDGDVQIVRNIQDETTPASKLLTVRTSGLRYDVKSGEASTDRAASFTYDRAEGKSTGAQYNPTTRELTLSSDAELRVRPEKPDGPLMIIQAGRIVYKEAEHKVYLEPWSKMLRDTTTLEGGNAVVALNEQDIDSVEAENAHGVDQRPERRTEYAAAHLVMRFDEHREVREITGERDARLVSTSANAQTTVTAERVLLSFATGPGGSVLERASAAGGTVVEAKPAARNGVPTPETKVLRSDVVNIKMKPGGEYLDSAETASPGTLEILPNRGDQRRRRIEAERLWVTYGEENRIKTFRATNVATRTEPLPPDPKKAKKDAPPPAPAFTWSKVLAADYDDQGQLIRMEQSQDFRYQEGDRQARSTTAVLEPPRDLITLEGGARVWDGTGSTSADHIAINQKTDEMAATGNVSSSRMPDKKAQAGKPASGGSLLDDNQPMQAKSDRMLSRDHNQQVRYEGSAVLWQGGNRLEADRVDIDRKEKHLVAEGHVVSQLADSDKGPASKPVAAGVGAAASPAPAKTAPAKTAPASPVYTVIHSPTLIYTDKDRVALYKGGVVLNRSAMDVKSQELRAFFKQGGSDSGLEKAFADGKVEIASNANGRSRRGQSEHAEYYVDDEKVLLSGGQPRFSDSLKGDTRGREITYYSAEDRFEVVGAVAEPARSKLLRRIK